MKKQYKMVCSICGSDNVLSDAYAAWDIHLQEWNLHDTYERAAYCNECDGECTIDKMKIEENNA